LSLMMGAPWASVRTVIRTSILPAQSIRKVSAKSKILASHSSDETRTLGRLESSYYSDSRIRVAVLY
jgi:hypothetical protein